jgi:hypothetical protein
MLPLVKAIAEKSTSTPTSSRLVRLVGVPRIIELDLLAHAEAAAWLEVQRAFLQQRSLPLLQRWLNEVNTRHEQYERAKARRADDPPVIQEASSRDRYRKLKSASAAVAYAFKECSAAFAERDCSRLNRWTDEHKLRSRHYAQLADEWLKTYPN